MWLMYPPVSQVAVIARVAIGRMLSGSRFLHCSLPQVGSLADLPS